RAAFYACSDRRTHDTHTLSLHDALPIFKGKTMVGEEIGINGALEQAGLEVVETDLGEYIIQLAKEPPSHIIAPAVHKTRAQICQDRKSTRLNSSHVNISYAVFCLKKKTH